MIRPSAIYDESFGHSWQAEILDTAPLIAPAEQYIYPRAVEEVERGALLVQLRKQKTSNPALLTFARGFADPALPHGLWSCPKPTDICAVAGGYAYIVDAENPAQWMQIPYRPATGIYPTTAQNLLIFASFHQLWALGPNGKAWETERLSWEGLRVTTICDGKLEGFGWDLQTDREVPFAVDLATGQHTGGAGPDKRY